MAEKNRLLEIRVGILEQELREEKKRSDELRTQLLCDRHDFQEIRQHWTKDVVKKCTHCGHLRRFETR